MYKKTACAQQFFAREAMHSTKGSRRGYDLLDHGENAASVLSEEERRGSMVANWKKLTAEIVELPKGSFERKQLGRRLQDLSLKINAIRPKRNGNRAVASFFVEVAKERLTKGLYDAVMAEAAKRFNAAIIGEIK